MPEVGYTRVYEGIRECTIYRSYRGLIFECSGRAFLKGGVMLRSAALLGNLALRDHAITHAARASI
jgi:hypothetical protein